MKLAPKDYPRRKTLPIRRQNAIHATETVNAALVPQGPLLLSGGVFYWGEEPEQDFAFEYGANILRLERMDYSALPPISGGRFAFSFRPAGVCWRGR